ncbi:MAG: acyl-CoA synthetase (AMP-forming)/AMP-acid ligase [Ilumatobacteraceae bacterium]|nr:acyl-CoA synthetase (AMP-forming)/AMP-acid ligase [Ilumatobacteraceae bacterium]
MASVARRGSVEAVVDGAHRVTYAELGQRVISSTRAMMAAGVGRGDRVAIWAPNGLAWIVAALGAQCAGAALVPVNTRWKGGEAAYLLGASRATVLCTSVGFLGTDTVGMLADDPTPLPDLGRIVLLDGSAPVAEAPDGVRVQNWAEFEADGRSVTVAAAEERLAGVEPTDPSDILFTSGTTGRPKGVVMTHAQTVRQFLEWCDFAGLEPDDRYLIVNPFFHMFGYKAGWLASLLRGATIFPVAVFDVAHVLAVVQAERITVLPGAPTIYRSILDHPDRATFDLSSLRVAVTGAADVPVALIEQMRAELPFSTILTGYGLTEAGTVTGSRPDDDATTIATTAGRAMNGLEIVIADAHGDEVERGATGELLVRGYSVMQGYLDDAAATAAAVDPNGYLHTGDLATMDERGYVRIVGRLKDMFIVGGFNVYPAEVENLLMTHGSIGQVAVIGVPDERMGDVGMAWVVPTPGRDVDPGEVIAWSRERMANYKVPRLVRIVDSLPINAAGKVVKEDLRARAISEMPTP